ncbi:MAG: arsenate reductase (glutaredoxin) [Lautropia sp.]|nr:arsenate reductase (glutaredoxin) [Lautropia sp.]
MSTNPHPDVVIYHNPGCGTSRKTLDAIREKGIEPTVVQYLKTGWTAAQLRTLFEAAGLTPRDALRTKQAEGAALKAGNASDEDIIAAMVADPVLVERPFVVTPKGARLCRPMETVFEVL